MKQQIKILALLVIAAIVASFTGEDKKQMLCRNWQWTNYHSNVQSRMMATLQSVLDTTHDEATKKIASDQLGPMKKMQGFVQYTSMQFNADNTYQTVLTMSGRSDKQSGTWSLWPDGTTLVMKSPIGTPDTCKASIAKDKLVIIYTSHNDTTTITMVPVK